MIMYYILIAAAIVALFYFVMVRPFRYWKSKGVEQQNLWTVWLESMGLIFQTRVQADAFQKAYNSFDGKRYFGSYAFLSPVLLPRDPDLIKQITVKDFDHFMDRNQIVSEEIEPLWGKNLVSLAGERWRDMRATLSPSFTGSKIRAMFGLMTECAEQFVKYFDKGDSKMETVEMKDAFTRYANDVIGSTAFGVTCDSLNDRENEFYLMGKEVTNFRGVWRFISFMIMFYTPTLSKLLGVRFFSKQVHSFFKGLVKENIEARERNGIVRPDMIHLLMEARKERLKNSIGETKNHQKPPLSDEDLTAQVLVFFFAGFESVSQLMCFTVYELALNPDIQSRLHDEVAATLKSCGGHLTYEALQKMKYFDMVISESLRKWPGAVAVDRICVKPYTIEPVKEGEEPVHVKKGEIVWIPIFAIHRDPLYFPEPERFDPERFNEENKGNIHPYTYIPFGAGPRNCIGNRFALLETKTVLFHLLTKFEFVVTEKTQIPLKLAKNQFNPTAENGFWVGLKPRPTQ